jgi:hypothetical protein
VFYVCNNVVGSYVLASSNRKLTAHERSPTSLDIPDRQYYRIDNHVHWKIKILWYANIVPNVDLAIAASGQRIYELYCNRAARRHQI